MFKLVCPQKRKADFKRYFAKDTSFYGCYMKKNEKNVTKPTASLCFILFSNIKAIGVIISAGKVHALWLEVILFSLYNVFLKTYQTSQYHV